jgi:hypothetical protein
VVGRRISAMADSDSPDLPSLRAVTALLREARSLSRRADKLGRSVAAAVDDPTTQQFAAGACSSVEQLVRHLTVLEHQLRQRERAAVRKQASVRRER